MTTVEPGADRLPRRVLGRGIDRVLQVQNDGVGAGVQRLVEPVGPVSRHEKVGCWKRHGLHRLFGAQALDPVRRIPESREDRVGVLAQCRDGVHAGITFFP